MSEIWSRLTAEEKNGSMDQKRIRVENEMEVRTRDLRLFTRCSRCSRLWREIRTLNHVFFSISYSSLFVSISFSSKFTWKVCSSFHWHIMWSLIRSLSVRQKGEEGKAFEKRKVGKEDRTQDRSLSWYTFSLPPPLCVCVSNVQQEIRDRMKNRLSEKSRLPKSVSRLRVFGMYVRIHFNHCSCLLFLKQQQ